MTSHENMSPLFESLFRIKKVKFTSGHSCFQLIIWSLDLKKKKTQDAIEAKLQTQGCLSYFQACISIYTYISNAFSQMKKHCPDGEFTKYLQWLKQSVYSPTKYLCDNNMRRQSKRSVLNDLIIKAKTKHHTCKCRCIIFHFHVSIENYIIFKLPNTIGLPRVHRREWLLAIQSPHTSTQRALDDKVICLP